MNNKIKEIKLDETNWLEITIVNELDEVVHCESFGDTDEYQHLLRQRCAEFAVELTDKVENILVEQNAKRYIATEEELGEISKQNIISELNGQIQEAKDYLSSTDFYMTVDKYATLTTEKQLELTTKRAEARELINTLEAELILLEGAK